jgi:general secretion pathway protein C
MGRLAIWIVNGVLFALCCFLVAGVVNALAGEWLAEVPALAAPPRAPAASVKTAARDRQVILDKNLFNVSTLVPQEPELSEDLEPTKLPLRLLGTAASTNPDEAWAAVEDQQNRKQLVVKVNDRLLDQAIVIRIDRRRIVLQNGAKREELALEEKPGAGGAGGAPQVANVPAASPAQARARPARNVADIQNRVRQLAENRFAVERQDVDAAVRNPSQLFSQARILPKYEDGAMVGIQLNAIQPGSLFENVGIRNGDTVTEVNGIVVSGPQDSAALLKELSDANEFNISVTGEDGSTRTLHYVVGEQ